MLRSACVRAWLLTSLSDGAVLAALGEASLLGAKRSEGEGEGEARVQRNAITSCCKAGEGGL